MKPDTPTMHPVAAIAAEAVHAVMTKGQVKHGETWRTRPDSEDLAHAVEHLRRLEGGDAGEDHLVHALARLAIVLARGELARWGR